MLTKLERENLPQSMRKTARGLHVQTLEAFHTALEALKKAGAVLVEFDVGLMLAEQHKNAPEFFTYDYEMPREIAR